MAGKSKIITPGELNKLRPVVTDKVLSRILQKPKSSKAAKALEKRAPQVHEPTKNVLLIKGHKTNQLSSDILRNLYFIRKPYSKLLSGRRQEKLMNIMTDHSDIEYLGEKNGCDIICMCSSTKKHPQRLFVSRLYNNKLYDLHETDVLDFSPLKMSQKNMPSEGSKPLVVFLGPEWDTTPELKMFENSLADLFGGIKASKVLLDGFDSAVVCTSSDRDGVPEIDIKHYFIELKVTAGTVLPAVELSETGFSLRLRPRGSIMPERGAVKAASRIPDEEFVKGKTGSTTNDLQQTSKKIYIQSESMDSVFLRHGTGKQ